jgi:hypothetical protein
MRPLKQQILSTPDGYCGLIIQRHRQHVLALTLMNNRLPHHYSQLLIFKKRLLNHRIESEIYYFPSQDTSEYAQCFAAWYFNYPSNSKKFDNWMMSTRGIPHRSLSRHNRKTVEDKLMEFGFEPLILNAFTVRA